MMAKIVEDIFDRLTYGKGPHRTKVIITNESTGAVDEFYILSEKYNFDDIKDRIRGLYAGNTKYDEYLSYVVRYLEFVLSDPVPDRDQQKIVYDALQSKYIQTSTGLMNRYDGRQYGKKKWDQAQQRFDKAMLRHIERLLETALIIED
jgi:hypothetical protein